MSKLKIEISEKRIVCAGYVPFNIETPQEIRYSIFDRDLTIIYDAPKIPDEAKKGLDELEDKVGLVARPTLVDLHLENPKAAWVAYVPENMRVEIIP